MPGIMSIIDLDTRNANDARGSETDGRNEYPVSQYA